MALAARHLMAPWFLNFARSASKIGYSLVSDLLGLPTRPLVLASACLPGSCPILETFARGGLLHGVLGTGSVILVAASVGALFGRNAESLARGAAAIYLLDGLAQLPQLLWPYGPSLQYPVSHTGACTLMLQLPAALWLTKCSVHLQKYIGPRYALLTASITLRYMSAKVISAASPSSVLLYGLAVVCFTIAITPRRLWRAIQMCLMRASKIARAAFSFVYWTILRIWPKVQAFVWNVLEHPVMVRIHRLIIAPCWQVMSPLFLPLATVALSYSCLVSLQKDIKSGCFADSFDSVLLSLGRVFCGATAILSSVILTMHAASRIQRREQPDPLKRLKVVHGLSMCSDAISCPWGVSRGLLRQVFLVASQLGVPALRCFLDLVAFSVRAPLVTIPCVLFFNVVVIRSLSLATGTLAVMLETAASHGSFWADLLARAVLELQRQTVSHDVTDSTFAMLLVTVTQIGTYANVSGVLGAVRALRSNRTGDLLGIEELNELAAAMHDPRQCGRCGFGPVDHRGCSNLESHHGELAVAAGGQHAEVSNACPRCGWFVASLNHWPNWDGELQTASGRAMYRQRVWSEIVLIVRAASKAFVFPYGLLRLGSRLELHPSLAAFLAFSYLVPWAVQNLTLARSISNPGGYRRVVTRRNRGRQFIPASRDAGENTDCGAQNSRRSTPLPNITESQALANIMAGNAEIVYLKAGDLCSVCREPFPEEAVRSVAGASGARGAQVCDVLRGLVPPIVALRCGHPLHVECAEAAVLAGGARHVLCPLCREPATLTGATSARMFS